MSKKVYYRIYHSMPKTGRGFDFDGGELYPTEESEDYCPPGVEVIVEELNENHLQYEFLPNYLFCDDEFEPFPFQC